MLKALQVRDFARLFYATLISEIGNRIHRIALLVLIYSLTKDALWVSATLGVQVVATLMVTPAISAWADSQERRHLLVISDLLRVLIVPLIPLVGTQSLWLLLTLVFIVEVLRNLHDPVANAVIPELVSDDRLDAANALMLFTDRFAEVAFVGAAGALVGFLGPQPAFWIDAASFLLSGLILLGLPPLRPKEQLDASYWSRVREGVVYVVRHPTISRVIGVNVLAATFGSAEKVLGVVLALSILNVGSAGFGVMEATMALGAVAGTLLVPYLTKRIAREQLFLLALMGFGLLTASVGAFPVFGWVLLAYLFIGELNMIFLIPVRSILQVHTPPQLRTRIFAAWGAAMNSAVLVGMMFAGALEKPLGAPLVFLIAGLWIVAVTSVTLLRGGIPVVPPSIQAPESTPG